jgi:hypothetical protein
MTLRETIEDDATTVFCNVDDFAESVVYYPRGGGSRSINAVVFREGVQYFIDDTQNAMAAYEVHVANDALTGISSNSINCGGDVLGFPPRDGKTATRHTIKKIAGQDNGMLVLICL